MLTHIIHELKDIEMPILSADHAAVSNTVHNYFPIQDTQTIAIEQKTYPSRTSNPTTSDF